MMISLVNIPAWYTIYLNFEPNNNRLVCLPVYCICLSHLVILMIQVADGVNAILVGTIGNNPTPYVFTGGNCSIQGFNEQGDDDFWTVCSFLNENYFELFDAWGPSTCVTCFLRTPSL